MALREIGAKLTIQGEEEWNRQMTAAARNIKNNSSALARLTAEYAGNANSVEALRKKQQLLQSKHELQKQKVEELRAAIEKSSKSTDEHSERTDYLRRQLDYAAAAVARTGRELDDVNGYLREAEASADGCATSIDEYGHKVKDAGDDTDDLLGKLNELVPGLDLTALKGKLTGAALAAAFKSAWDWAMNLVESTKEVRDGLARVETAAQSAGTVFDDEMNAALRDLFVLTGDMDSAFEALSNLLAAGYDGDGMAQAIEMISGAVVKFPDTLKLESLADSLQETLASRTATGQFSELLSRLGINVDEFTDAMQACTTTAQAQDLVFQTLADSGLQEANEAYEATAANAIALAEAEYNLQMEQAQLATSFVPLKTKITEVQASWTGFLSTLLDSYNFDTGPMALISAGISSGIAAGADEAGLSMREILDLLDEYGMTMEEASVAAVQAGQSTGEYLNTLAAQSAAAADATTATDEYKNVLVDHAANVEDALVVLEELKLKYEEIRGNIDSAVSGFTNMDEAMKNYETSANDMIAALDSQIEYLNNYQSNLQQAKEMGLSDALIEDLSDGSAQSAAYLEAIVSGGEEKIAELNEKFAQVETGKQAFVETVAGMLPEFTEALGEITHELTLAVGDWNKYDEAATAGQNTINGFTSKILQNKASVIALGAEIGNAFMSGYNSAMDIHSPSRRAGKAMDYTFDGFLQEGRLRMAELASLGGQMGAELMNGYSRSYAANAAAVRRQAQAGAAITNNTTNNRSTTNNFYPKTMDAGMIDYLVNHMNDEIGGSL